MAEITEKEIEKISSEIDQQGLTYIELKNEILDHICCQVEVEMEEGMLFNDAYRRVKEEMGKKRIRQIQHETLSLISKKYRRMKRLMYTLGVIAPALVIAASLFKLMHWPGAGIMITLGLFLIGMVFLPLYVMTRIRDTRKLGEPMPQQLYITGMISGMIAIMGALFKIQHWPGAAAMITVGLASFALIFLPMFARTKLKEGKKNNTPVNHGLLIGGVIAGILFTTGTLFKILHWPGAGFVLVASWSLVGVVFLPLLVLNQLKKSQNQTNTFLSILAITTGSAIFIMALIRSDNRWDIRGYYEQEKNNSEMADYYENRSQLILDKIDKSNNPLSPAAMEISVKAAMIDQYIDDLKLGMLQDIWDEKDEYMSEDGKLDLSSTELTRYRNFVFHKLYENQDLELDDMLLNFASKALKQTENAALSKLIREEFKSFSDKEDPENYWAQKYLTGPFIDAASSLSMFQSTVRLIEYEILKERVIF